MSDEDERHAHEVEAEEDDDDDEVYSLDDIDEQYTLEPLTPSAQEPPPEEEEEEEEQEPLSGPIGIVVDVHHLQSSFAIPAEATIDSFERALVARCGGGPICARFACDAATLSSDVEQPSKRGLHAQLRERGYELLLAPPRPLTGSHGATDIDMAACILDVARGRPGANSAATNLVLIAGDADFSSLLSRVLPPRRAHLDPSGSTRGGGAASPAADPAVATTAGALPLVGTPSALGVAPGSGGGGLRACVLVTEGELPAVSGRYARSGGSPASPSAGLVALQRCPSATRSAAADVDVRHADLLALLPTLVPGIDLREAKAVREGRRRRVMEAAAKLARSEEMLESSHQARRLSNAHIAPWATAPCSLLPGRLHPAPCTLGDCTLLPAPWATVPCSLLPGQLYPAPDSQTRTSLLNASAAHRALAPTHRS